MHLGQICKPCSRYTTGTGIITFCLLEWPTRKLLSIGLLFDLSIVYEKGSLGISHIERKVDIINEKKYADWVSFANVRYMYIANSIRCCNAMIVTFYSMLLLVIGCLLTSAVHIKFILASWLMISCWYWAPQLYIKKFLSFILPLLYFQHFPEYCAWCYSSIIQIPKAIININQ